MVSHGQTTSECLLDDSVLEALLYRKKQIKISKNYEDGRRERTGKPVQVDPGTLEAKRQLSSNLSPQAVEPPVQLAVPELLQLLSATASLSLR